MRTVQLFNDSWVFEKDGVRENVTLPHTWNALDGQDGGNNYCRTRALYTKKYTTPGDLGSDRLFLDFGAVNSIAEVLVNDAPAVTHEGGYSRFRADITDLLRPMGEENEIKVYADNRENDRVYPQFADYTFFGGIYRDVELLRVPEKHFAISIMGLPGITVKCKVVGNDAVCTAKAPAVGDGLRVCFTVSGDNAPEPKVLNAGEEYGFTINNVHLWDGRCDPYLYRIKAELFDGETALDCVEASFGARSFSVDPEKGFFLNGRSYPLRGVCRHQDREDRGWAIGKKEMDEDMELIMEVGANTIRLAHYQHNDYFYDLCDRKGLVIWAEIPFISKMLPGGAGNEISQMTELIGQNYNHPSIVCWGLSNEVTISSEADDELIRRHEALRELCRSMDPDRLTTMAQVSMLPIDSPMNRLTDLRSYNIYYGWYGGEVADNGPWLDSFHAANPDLPLGVSEYGCEAILKWHSDHPEQGDYSEEYQAYYHEEMLKTFADRPWLWATHVWNMFDFASDMRNEGGVVGRNHKGLVTFDRKTKKDSFYIYKAWWTIEPMVHICGRRFYKRAGRMTEIKVYSNLPEVELFVNGRSVGKKQGDKVFVFSAVRMRPGKNTIRAVSGQACDEITLMRVFRTEKAYVLESSGPVDNWFDDKLEFPKGYFSIKDKIKDIVATPEGKALFDAMMAKATESMGDFKIDDGMMKMAGSFSIQRIAGLAGDKMPKEMLIEINKQLNKIKKP